MEMVKPDMKMYFYKRFSEFYNVQNFVAKYCFHNYKTN